MSGSLNEDKEYIDAKEEIDLLGLLFEKYVEGAKYDREKGTVTIPKEISPSNKEL